MPDAVRDRYLSNFTQFEKDMVNNGQSWTREIRRAAIARFAELGFPTTRYEEWKYTNVAPITRMAFQLAPPVSQEGVAESYAAATIEGLVGTQLVFVNGHYAPELSTLPALPRGAEVGSLATILSTHPEWVQPHLARYAEYADHAFVALNTAFMQDGAFILVPPGVRVEAPIHLLFISVPRGDAIVSYPRNLLVMGEGTEATVIESYLGLGSTPYFTNAVTELTLGPNAVINHCKLERESQGAFHIATLQAHQDRSSNFTSHAIALGGSLVRNDINVVLAGEGGESTLNGLFMATGQQHVDNHTRIDHVKPHCMSRELYKGVLDGKARGVFNGKIVVHKDAQKTDAMQTNKNLLLSEDAAIDTKPQLEILNNDVKCSHGSTIGRLDENSIFYLRSRGLGLEAARSLLTYAFASEIVGRIKLEPIRIKLNESVLTWLPRGQMVKEAI